MSEKSEKKRGRIEPIRRVRGMQDFLPARAAGLRRIARIAEDVARLYGFERVEIPILERASLYRRSLGLDSDVVMKEMYSFEDKKDKNDRSDELCLRPEGTAGVVRMLIENGLTQTLPQRWFYEGAMFRRERPQRGRFRQFHQCGVECLHKPARDVYNIDKEVEVVACAWRFLIKLGLKDVIELKINWLGNTEERARYSEVLRQHFQQYAKNEALSDESIERLKRSPLRILDSKNSVDQEAIEKAPPFVLNKISQDNFDKVQESFESLKIPYSCDTRLVRGLDYYNGFVFEFVENRTERAQATVLAGGRYDGLCVELGGKNPVSAIGWAAGLERLLEFQENEKIQTADPRITKICLIGNDSFKASDYGRDLVNLIEDLRNEFCKNNFSGAAFFESSSYEEAEKTKPDYIAFVARKEGQPYQIKLTNVSTGDVVFDFDLHNSEVNFNNWLVDNFGNKNEDP